MKIPRVTLVAAALIGSISAATAVSAGTVAFESGYYVQRMIAAQPDAKSKTTGALRVAASVCKSQAYDRSVAEEYCGGVLQCGSKGLILKCHGRVRRWVCRCK